MIDLDDPLIRVSRMDQADWNEDRAAALAHRLADTLALRTEFEPPDEQWATLLDDSLCHGMVSACFPLALVTPDVVPALTRIAPDIVIVPIEDFWADELRGSASVLRSTVLPDGWELDFDTEAFSANDLFVEGV